MIYYMPFTHITDTHASELVRVMDKLTVLQPVSSLTSEHMRAWQDRNFIELRKPANIDENRLNRVLADYRQWSDDHKRSIGDLAGYFKVARNQAPMLDETAPNQIRTQIMRYPQSMDQPADTSVFQSAIFLAMAQEYDANQDSITRELESVRNMEIEMVSKLSGREHNPKGALSLSQSGALGSTVMKDPGTYMTHERIRSWACMALADTERVQALLTTSPAVWEQLRDTLPEPSVLLNCEIGSEHDPVEGSSAESRQKVLRTLKDIAFSNNPADVCMDAFSQLRVHSGLRRLTLYTLVGYPLAHTLADFAQVTKEEATAKTPMEGPPNTVIGFFELLPTEI